MRGICNEEDDLDDRVLGLILGENVAVGDKDGELGKGDLLAGVDTSETATSRFATVCFALPRT